MDEYTYQKFLEDKLKDEHVLTHLLQSDVTMSKQRIVKLLKDLSQVRKAQNDLKLKNKQMEEKLFEQQIQIKKLKENRNQRAKEVTEKRVKEENANQMDSKQIFKMYLDNTFPKYKGLLKKILKVLFILQENDKKEPLQKIKFYRFIFEEGVKRILDWLFPKKQQVVQNKKQLAETLVKEWKQKEKGQKTQSTKANAILLKETAYLKQIEDVEAKILIQNTTIKRLEGRIKTYERSMQAKGAQFVAHLKKMMENFQDPEQEAKQYVQRTMKIFKTILQLSNKKPEEEKQSKTQIPLVLSQNAIRSSATRKKPAPILKKNIFGYYQDPQFAGNYALPQPTKHVNLNKFTQTLSEDLCVLTLHPVILVTLIDANVKMQRNRHSLQHYVRIKINEESLVDSTVKEGLDIIWNQPFLLKDYDFPFIFVQLMHKTKGLRDYALGGGKFSASSEQQKIVNVRKQKEFIGRVRFSLSYPKGNIYQFKITSVIIEIPSSKHLLKQQVHIQFPYNPLVSVEFQLPDKIVYIEKSVIILQNCEENMVVSIPKQDLKEKVSLTQFTAKEGHKQVVVVLDDWKVIIQGQIYLLICEESQPERISEDLLEGGQGKFFSVRAPPPIVTITYDTITLHSNIKFPLVFQLDQAINSLSIVKELYNRELQEEKVEAITDTSGLLKLSEMIKAPKKIYKFFIETLEGEQVMIKHENHLFQRLLKEIHLQVSYKEDEIQQINYARKGKKDKQKLYKQFAIQTKLLMLNHYKVFSRHFKRIGFVKFKLGYTIYDNQLLTQSGQHHQTQEIDYNIPEGVYFVDLELTNAHLNSQSNSSQYSVKINNQESKKIKGNQPFWKEGYTFDFQLKNKFQFAVSYQIIEYATFSTNVIYSGTIVINESVLELGALIVQLDQKGKDCLHFSNISIPQSIYHLVIESVEAQIQEEADWIGKIDPYLTLQSKNRHIHKTQYLDNIGSHPVWQNINQKLFISSDQSNKQNQEIMKCQIHDYDLIGRDDYIGEVVIGTKLNPELLTSGKSDILYGSIVKQNSTCGGMRLRGKFQKLNQKKLLFKTENIKKISRKDLVYKLVLYSFHFNDLKQFEDERGWINLIVGDNKVQKYEFVFNEAETSSANCVIWDIQEKQFTFEIEKEYKNFFKTSVDQLGTFKIKVSEKQFKLDQIDITNEEGKIIGFCKFYIEVQNNVKYAMLSNYTCCKNEIKLKSDLNDEIVLQTKSDADPHLLFYHENIFAEMKIEDKKLQVKMEKHKEQILKLKNGEEDHQDEICYIKLKKQLQYESTLEETSQRQKIEHDRNFKQIKYFHWQPYKYNEKHEYKLTLSTKNNEKFQLIQKLSNVYNSYLKLETQAVPIVFDIKNIPKSLVVTNLTNNTEEQIALTDDISKVYIPNKGALYYHLQDYNEKSILQIHFTYLFLKVKNIKLLNNFNNISAHLGTSLNVKNFSCKSLAESSCFVLENINLCIAEPPHSGTFFFSGYLQGSKEQSKLRQKIMEFKFGIRLENNKSQYRFVDSEEIVVHTFFKCCLVERNYESPQPVDNTIYGMSFIELTGIQFEVNEDPTEKPVYIELMLNNQHEKMYLQRVGQSNSYVAKFRTTFFIQAMSYAEITIIEEGILTNTTLGTSIIQLSESYITKETVQLHSQVKKDDAIIGRISFQYTNIRETEFIDVNLFSYISKSKELTMQAELQQFGPNKEKYQSITLTSKGDVPRLQSEDSFIVFSDPRDYQINVSEKYQKKLLGEFKLCHQLKKVGDKITVLQPLRTSTDSLNGVLIIEYEKKQANTISLQKNKDNKLQLIEMSLQNLTFKKHYDKLKDDISINIRTHARNNTSKPMPIGKVGLQKPFVFTLYNNQNGQISLRQKSEVFASTSIRGPYFDGESRMIIFQKDKKPIGLCNVRIRYITSKKELELKREIVSVQAFDLMDTQFFVKMKPFIEIQSLNQQKWPLYLSDIGLGKENIFWKLNIISDQDMNFIFKDQDMFFDDLIGNAVLNSNKIHQKEEVTTEMTLFSEEGDNRKGGNGKIKISTQPIVYDENQQPKVLELQQRKVDKYLLRIGGINKKIEEKLNKITLFEVSIGTGLNKYVVKRAKYNEDLLFYLQNKDIEIEIDSAFLNNPSLAIFITLYQEQKIVTQQVLNLSSSEKEQSEQIFTICQLVSLEGRYLTFSKIYFWLFDKLSTDIQVYAANNSNIEKLNLVRNEKRLIVAESPQMLNFSNQEIIFLVLDDKEQIFKLALSLSEEKVKQKKILQNGTIRNDKENDIGIYYVEIDHLYSEGSDEKKKNMIGKSRKEWICITIVEASLTKDLEWFSKMDPYCKFSIASSENYQQIWKKTSVQEDIGMKPVWNETFFSELTEELKKEAILNILVMDSQVTLDRKIGGAQRSLGELLQSENTQQIQVFDDDKNSAGKLLLRWKLQTKNIIFRNIKVTEGIDEDKQFLFFHESNVETRKGTKILEGIPYPINNEIQIKIKYGDTTKTFTFLQLKGNAYRDIVFKKQFSSLSYQIYD